MQFDQWIARCEGRFGSVEFVKTATAHLEAIRTAPDLRERAREAGRFGGFVRGMLSLARVELAEALIQELAVEPTQHVAFMLMKRAFSQAAETATLNQFAKPGRDASEKHMDAARAAATKRPDVIARYRKMYVWYDKRLDAVIGALRAKARKQPLPGPGGARPARRSPRRPRLRQEK